MATPRTTRFELTGADGGPLRGEVRTAEGGRDRPAVVICHGFKGFKDWGFFPHLAHRLARAGTTAVTFNFSSSGVGPDGESFSEPERFGHGTFSNDVADLATVCDRLLAGRLADGIAPATALGLFGHSRGGGTAILYTAGHDAVRALVTWAAVSTVMRWDAETVARWRATGKLEVVNVRTGDVLPLYRTVLDDMETHGHAALDIPGAAARIRIPWLIVHGDADESVSPQEGRELKRAATGERVELRLVRGGTHTLGARHPWAGSTPELDEAMAATVEWFGRYLVG